MIRKGILAMLPITSGILPFGLVMGTVSSTAQLDLVQTVGMNLIVFAGASQIAAIDLMMENTSILVVVITGLIINMRILLYSAAFSPYVQKSSWLTKTGTAYCLADQTYAILVANEKNIPTRKDAIAFYLGAGLCTISAWHIGVLLGFLFGNFAPASLSLDYAVPLSFASLTIPSLKNKNYAYVALCSAFLSIMLKPLPYNLGLLTSALIAISLGIWLSRGTKHD